MNTVSELHTDRTTISLSKENYEKLKKLGFAGESFNLVIGRLLEKVKEVKQMFTESAIQVGKSIVNSKPKVELEYNDRALKAFTSKGLN